MMRTADDVETRTLQGDAVQTLLPVREISLKARALVIPIRIIRRVWGMNAVHAGDRSDTVRKGDMQMSCLNINAPCGLFTAIKATETGKSTALEG